MFFVLPFLKNNLFWKNFGSSWAVVVLPVFGVSVLGQFHWTGYLLTLILMDVAAAINNITLGVVLLRCLPWDYIVPFYTQVSAVGGFIYALSFCQLSLNEALGSWILTSLIGHGLALLAVTVLYATHWRAILEIRVLLKVPVHSKDALVDTPSGEPADVALWCAAPGVSTASIVPLVPGVVALDEMD
mmetsp:Transcript_64305/g.209742  ORF Transcript_64305/g.209742 Transcript_64305/m.209742 type:complete len:187 (-) Transcript_64305:497-1057(-)